MKKLIVSLLLLTPALAFASTPPTDIHPDNGNPLLVMQPWGLTMAQSQHLVFASGTTKTLADGTVFTCPWYYPAGCVDVSGLRR